MLPQANQARKAIWEAVNPHTGLRRIDEAFPKAVRTSTQEHEMLIRFRNGSTWQVVGSDNFNSLVGSPPIGLTFSEWALCDPAAWAYLMPIVEENGGWVIFNTTPRGKNHAYRSLAAARLDPDAFAEVIDAKQTGIFNDKQLTAILAQLVGVYGTEYGQALFDQEYGCSFEAANLGAILGRWLTLAEREGRIGPQHDYDPMGAPVQISSDIGRRDASSWFFWQPCVGGYRIVDFDKDSGLDADEWCDRLGKTITERGYKLGRIWLPHDAKARTFAARNSAVETFILRFGFERMGVVPDATKTDRINAARRIVRKCSFHGAKTEKGRDGLAAWCYEYDEERKEFSREPRHDWASHDGDAFSYGAMILEEVEPVKEDKTKEPRTLAVGQENTYTMNDAWADHSRSMGRRNRV